MGFVVRITLSVLCASNSSSATFCLGWELVCPECFLNVLAPPSALGFLWAPSPETLSTVLPLPLGNCCCFYLLAGNREVLHYPGSVSGKPLYLWVSGVGLSPSSRKTKGLKPRTVSSPSLKVYGLFFFFSFHSS